MLKVKYKVEDKKEDRNWPRGRMKIRPTEWDMILLKKRYIEEWYEKESIKQKKRRPQNLWVEDVGKVSYR